MKTLQAIGWNWRTDGVEVCAQVDGQRYQVFVPLNRVWHEFAKALAENGTPMPAQVGGACTVAGLLQGIEYASRQRSSTPAVGWFGSSIAHAVSKAAGAVTHVALAPVAAALKPVASVVNAGTHALSGVPVFGSALAAATTALTSPVMAANSLAAGGKISSVAMNTLKNNISSIRTLAPYAQTVISVVPGVGQGLSGAIGAGLALASGMSITQAVEAGVRDALPGGPLARAAFDVASAAAQGKPISQIALSALPVSPQQKQTLVQGIGLARDLAAGKNVSRVLIDQALNYLPPEAAKAVQIATALAHAKNLQQVVGVGAQAAGVSQALAHGVAAAQQLMSHPPSLPAPPHLVAAVQRGLQAKQLVSNATQAAAQGHGPSSQFLAFLQKPKISGPIQGPRAFVARFHSAPAHAVHQRSSGIHSRHQARVGAPVLKSFTARFHTAGAQPSVSGIHSRWGVFRHQTESPPAPRQLYPVRMPYQTAAVLRHAYGR